MPGSRSRGVRNLSRKFLAVLLAPVVAIAIAFAAPARAFDFGALFVNEDVVDVTVRPGVTVRYLGVSSKIAPPVKAVILFAGADGLLGMTAGGTITTDLEHNFLVRSRRGFAHQGLFVAVVDTPGAVAINGMVRLSFQYSDDIGKVILDVRMRSGGLPVWLVGTSSGTISAASVASKRPLLAIPGAKVNWSRPDGIVLTSTQSKPVAGLCGKTVFDAKLTYINVPAFAVAHKEDDCDCSPPVGAEKVIAALTGSPFKESQFFIGGLPPMSVEDCQALTPHGFYGIEPAVVVTVADWIKTH